MSATPLAVITGTGSGIGRALAYRAAVQEGYHVALIDIDANGIDRTLEQIRANGGSASAHPLDITDAAALDSLAAELATEWGAPGLLMCNAGVEYAGRLWEMTPEEWKRVQSINVDGQFFTARAFLPSMMQAKKRSHVLITSSVGGIGIPAFQGAYAVSKHAVRVLAQALAADLKDAGAPVDISILLPAAVQTPIFENAPASQNEEAVAFRERMLEHLVEQGKTPEQIADDVFEGLRQGKRWIYPSFERGEFFVKQHVAELLAGIESSG